LTSGVENSQSAEDNFDLKNKLVHQSEEDNFYLKINWSTNQETRGKVILQNSRFGRGGEIVTFLEIVTWFLSEGAVCWELSKRRVINSQQYLADAYV
jgi:hypothetical protein